MTVDGDQATLTSGNLNVTLSLDPATDRTNFTGAKAALNAEEGTDQLLLFSKGERTFAATLITREDGAAADVFFDRTASAGPLARGTAKLTGTYVGSFIGKGIQFSGPIAGVLTLDVDLDAMTMNGGVTDRTIPIPFGGTEFLFTLSEETDILFPEMRIGANGLFSGTGQRDVPSEGNPDNDIAISTDVSGVIDGTSIAGLEVVGSVAIEAMTTGASGISTVEQTTREVGVFAAGH